MMEKGGGIDPDKYAWTDPAAEYRRRLGPDGENPEAVENMYFAAMLLLSGVRAARERLLSDCDSGKIGDEGACRALRSILSHPLFDDPGIEAASSRQLLEAQPPRDGFLGQPPRGVASSCSLLMQPRSSLERRWLRR